MDKAVKILQSEFKILVYRNILKDFYVKKLMKLLKAVAETNASKDEVLEYYLDFVSNFLSYAVESGAGDNDVWQEYILNLILLDDNVFSRQAESLPCESISEKLKELAGKDLQQLQLLASVSGASLRSMLTKRLRKDYDEKLLPDWEGISRKEAMKKSLNEKASSELIDCFRKTEDWGEVLEPLCRHYYHNGVGIFGRFHCFRWVKNGSPGKLVGVANPDPVRLEQLYEYKNEQEKIIENTEQFLAGYPANNVLLYGDRGTGKSSTVKALVNEYGAEGLRLVEMQKQDLGDFPEVVALLAGHPQKFLLFIDDLSFNEQEGQYRDLKALLEGGLESRPKNVLVYATSNRRHLVQEKFTDRDQYFDGNDDVRHMDTMQEKLSLADRFGITVTFITPDQKRYLAIVEKMVKERKIAITNEELKRRALKWELSFNTRSARTAKQFVDYLEGQMALKESDSTLLKH